jgi:hypothetical protein
MKSLIATMPGYLEDKKDQEKLQRGLQDSLYKLDQADRLEKIGMIKEAAALKHEASQFDKEVMKLQHEAVENRLKEEGALKRAKIMAGASITGDVIRANSTEKELARTDATVRGQDLQALGQRAKIYAAEANDLTVDESRRKIAKQNLEKVMKDMDSITSGRAVAPKSDYDVWKETYKGQK